MSTAKLLVGIILACFLPCGFPLKCYSYDCSTSELPSPSCTPPQPVTCVSNPEFPGMSPDRCDTKRIVMEMSGITVQREIRNCSYSLKCNMRDAICNAANVTMFEYAKLKSCEVGCCKGDLCNSGGPIPTQAPGPTGPSGADLSCYTCSDVPNSAGLTVKNINCKNPAKQTCGVSSITGMPQDRCATLKIKAKVAIFGIVEQEMKNCSDVAYCNKKTTCSFANHSGKISSCGVSCCSGNLCNTDAIPTMIPEKILTQFPNTIANPATLNVTADSDATIKTRMPAAFVYLSVLIGKMAVYNLVG